MDAHACKDKQDLGTAVRDTSAPAVSVAVSHTASAAEHPVDEPADSTAQADVSPADNAASPCERLDSTTPCPSATAAARASQPSSRPSEVVDLTADDAHSVQQSASTGVGTHPIFLLLAQHRRVLNFCARSANAALPVASVTAWLMCLYRCSIGSTPVQPRQTALIDPSSAAYASGQGGEVAADRSG